VVTEPSPGARGHAPGRFAVIGRVVLRLRWPLLLVLLAASAVIALWPSPGATSTTWFARDSFWNRPLPGDARLDPSSAAMVTALAAASSTARLSNDHDWGIPVDSATTSDPSYSITSLAYAAGPQPVTCRVPAGARANQGSDGHLAVLQPDGSECDFWLFSRTAGGAPKPGAVGMVCGTVWGADPTAWGTRPCRGTAGNGVTASGFALTGGIVRPRELSDSGAIRHALTLSLPTAIVSSGVAWPGAHSDGRCASQTSCIPEGATIRLDPSFNVSRQPWPGWEKRIARAMQTYGARVGDQGGSLELRAQEQSDDSAWTRIGVPIDASLTNLPWASMQVLQITSGPGTPPPWWTGG
jgi:hypothetical protein